MDSATRKAAEERYEASRKAMANDDTYVYKPRRKVKHTATMDFKDWQNLVAVFARHCGHCPLVAQELNWPVAKVRRIFNKGMPTLGLPPIKTVLAMDSLAAEEIRSRRQRLKDELSPLPEGAEGGYDGPPIHTLPQTEVVAKAVVIHEREQVRVRQLVEAEEERRKAREDRLAVRAEETMLIDINRKNAIALNGVTAHVMKGALALSENVQLTLEQIANDDTVSIRTKIDLLKSAASIAKFATEATNIIVRTERIAFGESAEPSGETPMVDDGSLEHAAEWVERAAGMVQKARVRGILGKGAK